ncbi:glycogen debranching protein [Angustibacter sp. Root456]|nr:glycogen debranching protein GlgX [Angustibacter sp. Root456]KQX69644.1 glycogen debranching protein [Angustibacter sp. Root456]
MTPRPLPEEPPALGVTLRDGGADVAVYAEHADAVEVCVGERRVELGAHLHGVHYGFVPDLHDGDRYGLRVHGPWDPARGLRHNPAKLLLDPYARALAGEVDWRPEVFGHRVDERLTGDPEVRDDRDSAPFVPRGVVVGDGFDWGDDRRPRVPWSQTVVYEAHVRGLTRRLPGVPEHLRGTYAGLAHPATVEHLTSLGVTTVELLPIHAFTHEPALVRRGARNYWGYNTLSFFAPHPSYASTSDPRGVLDEVKGMVRLLHQAGLEVVLDVVYNHTCEQGRDGALLSWRGLDNPAYYRLDDHGRDVDVTGCGNTMNFCHPRTVQLALDSLRYWAEQVHVDGFRFDLATALARGADDAYDCDHPFLVALRTDPVLSRLKLVAEPWDVGPHGWRTGQFPPPMAEWNDRFRDTARSFWLADAARELRGEPGHGVRELATRLSGSQDLFGRGDRGPLASVNYVAAHDGFTVADTTAYERKHNEGNGEGNLDGHDDNRSWNHGVEGETHDPVVLAGRRRSIRNLLGTLLLSTGVPMLAAGDELGRTQHGNNNAYNRDDEVSWLDWDLQPWQHDLLATTTYLLRVRREHPVLRQRQFFGLRPPHADGTVDLGWFGADGRPMDDGRWHDPHARVLQAFLHGSPVGGDSLLLVLCGAPHDTDVALPGPPWAGGYELVWDSADERPTPRADVMTGVQRVRALSLRLYRAR